VSILLVSYVAFSFALWLLCIAARGFRLYRLGRPANTARSGSAPRDCADVLGPDVDQGCRRPPRTRQRGCEGRQPRRRQASA
jgi:hypothetical protein